MFSDECYCGNSFGQYNATAAAKCFFNCGGKYKCGGYNANSVYEITKGNFKQNVVMY